jgi:hypothetical protein
MSPDTVHTKYKIQDSIGVNDGDAVYVFTTDIRDAKNMAGYSASQQIDMALLSGAILADEKV